MVDIHNHLLPGLDDGPQDLDTSVAMARLAAGDGITHIVATPHANHHYVFDPAAIAERLDRLRTALAEQSVAITLGSGCDFHLSYENLQDAQQHPHKYAINGKRYLLVELPDFNIPRQLDEAFYDLRMRGLEPVLTHPERNPILQKNSARLEEWLRHGMLVQITAGSLLGQMGPVAEKVAHRLLANRWVHFLASDAHGVKTRPPRMQQAAQLVARRYGDVYAQRLCLDNPLAVFEGRPLPAQPEPLHLHADDRPSLWQRLFSR